MTEQRGTVIGARRMLLLLLALSAAVAGMTCASMPFGRTAEPPVIAVRNRSSEDIATVTLRGAGSPSDRAARFGSLSPVPVGVTQSYARPKDAPPFPARMTIEWSDSQGRVRSRDVKVSAALRSATGAAGEMLVFEFGSFDDVRAFIEHADRPADAADPGTALDGGPWTLLEVNSAVVLPSAGEKHPSLQFQRQDGRVTGYTGCNEFFGSVDLRGDALAFGHLGMTRRSCADAAGETEQAFLGVLSKVRSWRIERQILLLMDGNQVLARLRQERRGPGQ